jgi:hypothetical protein
VGSKFLGAVAAGLCLFLAGAPAFSLGAKDETEPEIQDPLWTLTIAAFDASALSSAHSGMVDIIMRRLVENINQLRYRVRVSQEYSYYESLARSRDLSSAAQALVNKRNDRDQFLYAGDPEWKYRKNIKIIDKEIKILEENYRKALAAETIIEQEPAFTLAQQNLEGLFPQAPKEGQEHKFCKAQRSDAFITGTMSEYYGRIFITLRLYVLYVNSYVYQDSIIFSPEDAEESIAAFASGINAAIAGAPPAGLKISVRPPEALILLDQRYAGRGEVAIADHPPGNVILEVFADNYTSVSTELELKGGELTEVTADLRPLELSPVIIRVPGKDGSSVYQGSQYVGETPVSLDLPRNHLEYIYVQSPDGEEAEAVFLTPSPDALPPAIRAPRRPEFFAGIFRPKNRLEGNELSLHTAPPYNPEEKRVDKARRLYYWAWGGTWVSAIAAWMVNGYANSVINSYNLNPTPTREMYESALLYQKLNYVGIGLVSAAVLFEAIQIGRYIYIAGKDAPVYVD